MAWKLPYAECGKCVIRCMRQGDRELAHLLSGRWSTRMQDSASTDRKNADGWKAWPEFKLYYPLGKMTSVHVRFKDVDCLLIWFGRGPESLIAYKSLTPFSLTFSSVTGPWGDRRDAHSWRR